MNERRRQLEQILQRLARPHDGSSGRRFTCPCCGYPMLTRRGAGEICDLCSWEDEGLDDDRLGEPSSANAPYSLAQARTAFARYGTMYHPADDPRIGGADTPAESSAKAVIRAAFDAIDETTTPGQLEAVWETVDQQIAILERELKRKVAEYELQQRRGRLGQTE